MGTIYVQQQGAGNGKTYNLVRLLDNPMFHHFDHYILVAKQHSVKYILYRELLQQAPLFTHLKLGPASGTKKYTILAALGTDWKNITISTLDSLFYGIGKIRKSSRDMFHTIAESISLGITEPHAIDHKTCIFLDESQDTPELYGRALLRLALDSGCSIFAAGDLLQSIYFENNAFRFLLAADYAKKVVWPAQNICRRFSGRALVDFVNRAINFEKYKLPAVSVPRAVDCCEPTILVQPRNIVKAVQAVMKIYTLEVEQGRSAADFLIISPFVRDNNLAAGLETEIKIFWSNRLQKAGRYVFLHMSEESGPIDLSLSAACTRIVSIHTAKGDGRPVVIVVNLSERALLHFSGAHNLIYDSMLHVALTRMKEKLYIFRDKTADDISHRILGTNRGPLPIFNIGAIHLMETLKNNLFSIIPMPTTDITFPATHQHVDMTYHNLRYRVMLSMLAVKIGLPAAPPCKYVNHWVNRLDCEYVPIIRCWGTPFVKIWKYMQIVLSNFSLYKNRAPCVLESIFIYYAIDKRARYNTLVEAFKIFGRSNDINHSDCPCALFFAEKKPTAALNTFFEQAAATNILCQKLLQTWPMAHWQYSGKITFMVGPKEINLAPQIIGQYADEKYVVICKPYLNNMNYADVILLALLYEYALIRFKTTVVILALNMPAPITVTHAQFIDENIFTIDAVFRACIANDLDIIEKKINRLEPLIQTNEGKIGEFLKDCQSAGKVDLQNYASAGEQICADALKKIFPGNLFVKCRPKWLKGLELDFYCEELQIALEFNGLQHYRFVPCFHRSMQDLIDQKERDRKKASICHSRSIKLIVIRTLTDLEDQIRKFQN
jgi:hypothetical protein